MDSKVVDLRMILKHSRKNALIEKKVQDLSQDLS